MRLKDKVAIVTGAGSGIGRATSRLFAREGAMVVVAERRAEPGRETVRLIEEEGGQACFVETDVSVTADVRRMVKIAVETYGKLDILINNAAAARSVPVTELNEEDWQYTLDNCLKSVYLGAKYAIPEMLKVGRGAIVNISSVNGLISNPNFSAYSAAKAGVLGLTRNLAIDYGLKGIRVNAICPGFIANDLMEERLAQDALEKWATTETQPVGRYGKPEDIAYAVLYLASDEAGYVTGATLVVDGGLTIQSPEALVRPSFRRRWRRGVLTQRDE
jgi:NAD(P)-dependent dehydrogenase (short-subunit alcohol dehydrogenase family)